MATRIQLRRGNAADWANTNPVLAQGEAGIELDTSRVKFGTGLTAWNDLPYSDSYSLARLQSHVDDTTPHAAYDDMQSLSLIFENGLI